MDIRPDAEILRNDDGTLSVEIEPDRSAVDDETTASGSERVTVHPGEGGDPIPPHKMTKIIGEVLHVIDT